MQAQLSASDISGTDGTCCVTLLAPHSGSVLEIADESARLVQAGNPLLTIGDLGDLQIETDLKDPAAYDPTTAIARHKWQGAQ
ncbi:MAG: hypothetical protein H7317_08010 [Pseudorhodobacter sp.]|nr:hypothetical protein [Pseudorhodobacter sp.]